jgi:hypothetical protein
MSRSIGVVTCQFLPEADPDEGALLSSLRALGDRPEMVAWDDPAVDWQRFDLCVLRSTWNYFHDLKAFLEWAERVARMTHLCNGLEVVRWNAHKGYLRELASKGVAIVPTEWVRDPTADLERVRRERGWSDLVVKPAVSAGSFETHRVRGGQPAPSLARGDWMVQPYLGAVETYGERSLVWIDGEFTHSVRKSPRFSGGHESVSDSLPLAPDEFAFGRRAIDAAPRDLLYARVDITRADDGELYLMELELIEPSLFLVQAPASLARFARAVNRAPNAEASRVSPK